MLLTDLFYLIGAHFVFDFPLQGADTAMEKNNNSKSQLQAIVPWYYWMTAHCFMQAIPVAMITGSVALGLAEFVVHFVTDFAKCNRYLTLGQDQAIHIACKILWAALAAGVV